MEGPSPDIVIVDAERLGEETLAAMRALVEGIYEGRDAPGLVVIGAERGEWLSEALRAGVVRGTLPRAASSGEIIAAVLAVSSGLIAVDAETFAAVLAPAGSTLDELPDAESYDERLTDRRPGSRRAHAARTRSARDARRRAIKQRDRVTHENLRTYSQVSHRADLRQAGRFDTH